MKIVAQDAETLDPPDDRVRFFVVEDDDYDLERDDTISKAFIISRRTPERQTVFNGTMALGHGGWYPFTGAPELLDELLSLNAHA